MWLTHFGSLLFSLVLRIRVLALLKELVLSSKILLVRLFLFLVVVNFSILWHIYLLEVRCIYLQMQVIVYVEERVRMTIILKIRIAHFLIFCSSHHSTERQNFIWRFSRFYFCILEYRLDRLSENGNSAWTADKNYRVDFVWVDWFS